MANRFPALIAFGLLTIAFVVLCGAGVLLGFIGGAEDLMAASLMAPVNPLRKRQGPVPQVVQGGFPPAAQTPADASSAVQTSSSGP